MNTHAIMRVSEAESTAFPGLDRRQTLRLLWRRTISPTAPSAFNREYAVLVVAEVSNSRSRNQKPRIRSRVTSFDVAALAGVSQSAVSRAFTPGSSIADDTQSPVIEAARRLNYVPNSIASSLTTKRTNIVALILGNRPIHFTCRRARSLQHPAAGSSAGRC